MKSIKIGMIVAVAVIGVLAMAGSAQAAQAVFGEVNDAEWGGQGEAVGKLVTIWIENDTANFKNQVIEYAGASLRDYYLEADIMDLPAYPETGSVYVSVQMFASGIDEDDQPYDNDGCYFDEINKLENLAAPYVTMPIADLSCSKTSNIYLGQKWNLISMPLTNATMTVENVINTSLGGSYDALCKYNASSNNYETLSSTDVMENGVGYFIHMTQADTWTYSGAGYTSMNEPLEDGLNMVGWLDCNKTISSGLTSIAGNYAYAASWNATAQEFETYNPAAPDPDTPGGFNDFFDMERGTGYFLSMKTSDTLDEDC